jgi:hypothetical protein
MNIDKLKYPIGKFIIPNEIKSSDIKKWITTINDFPKKVFNEVNPLSISELNYKYRPKGWTIKQIIGHCLDSHMNSFIRHKLALTEQNPVIRPYKEDKWAELDDTLHFKISENLQMLTNIHKRWVFLLESLSDTQLDRTFIHPDGNETITLKENLCIYAWHCNHHLQHIINAKKFKF